MDALALSIRGVGKRYTIGGQPAHSTLYDRMSGVFGKTGGGERRSEFWALRDISFEVGRGQVVGIMGRNGSGKSTLMKILAQVTTPTEGEADVYGRVGALLEVGMGFHPELTGRENIYLCGAILGMSRREIAKAEPAIIDFADVEKFIETPVKRYSSGMFMRLAFGVSAYLSAEIMLIDEILAVGDVEFQLKCLQRMRALAQDGRTVLFISHDPASIATLCHWAIVLDQGRMIYQGPTSSAIEAYIQRQHHGQYRPHVPLD
jgi:lipopolysaccharide transport system ATP-binding protein